jgi:hypothetical protein
MITGGGDTGITKYAYGMILLTSMWYKVSGKERGAWKAVPTGCQCEGRRLLYQHRLQDGALLHLLQRVEDLAEHPPNVNVERRANPQLPFPFLVHSPVGVPYHDQPRRWPIQEGVGRLVRRIGQTVVIRERERGKGQQRLPSLIRVGGERERRGEIGVRDTRAGEGGGKRRDPFFLFSCRYSKRRRGW